MGGIAHPPGYPTYVLWLRLWHWLPVASAAYGAALATAILGALGVWALQRACVAWGASIPATAVTSSVYAFSPLAWKMSSHAEVHAMNALFAAIVVGLASPSSRVPAARRVVALGLVAGAAIAAHQSIVLLAPVGILAAVRAVRETKRPWLSVARGVLALFVGLLPPYAYVYVVARTSDRRATPMWIDGATLRDVFFDVRRGTYGTLSLSSIPVHGAPLAQLSLFATTVTRHLLGLPLLVLLAGALAVARARPLRVDARAVVALASSFVLAGPVFVATFNVPLIGAGPTVVERFYLMPEVVITVLAALSLDALVPWLVARDVLAAGLSVVAALAAGLLSAPEVREHHRPTVALYIDNTLAAAAPNAIIVGTGDHRWGGFLYARYVTHLRPDVVTLVPAMLRQPWYRKDAEALTGVSLDTPSGTSVGARTLLARLLATGRPILYTDWPEPALESTPHYSVGTLMRVLYPGEVAPTLDALAEMNRAAFEEYELEASPPTDPHGWGYGVEVDYARPWGELGDAYGRHGDIGEEQECYRLAGELAPWLVNGASERRP